VVAVSDQPSIPARRLAERLRALREREYRQLTQGQLAKVLGCSDPLSTASVSLWEKPSSDRLPPPQRLAAYARLFCTARSFPTEGPRLLRDDELTEEEQRREAELYEELMDLRDLTQAADDATATVIRRDSIWRFPDGKAVSIACSEAVDPPPYASPDHLNYIRYAKHADLDALMEVFGQVRSDNPASFVRVLLPEELIKDFALNHLVIIGGAAVYNTAPYFAQDIPLPAAEPIPNTATHLFRCTVGKETREFSSTRIDETLLEDVGLIARGSHPYAPGRTVTVLSGITSRGVHGAALCFTDPHVRSANQKYLDDNFGNADAFCILMRIPVRENTALPPNLSREGAVLYAWSAETGAHW
jgi:transcriptional regulator with XRE-family HTH domain